MFGLQWLRKAVLRAAGLKAKHDEDAIFAGQVAELSAAAPPSSGRDATAFTVAFKGVFLEGLEVVVIVLTLGSTSHRLGLAAVAAAAAVLVVVVVGLVVHRQLSGVPENAMKMGVGLMLVSFGTFWVGRGRRTSTGPAPTWPSRCWSPSTAWWPGCWSPLRRGAVAPGPDGPRPDRGGVPWLTGAPAGPAAGRSPSAG